MSSPTPPDLPWLRWGVGERVVLRHRGPDGVVHEALGHLTEVARDHVCLETRRGKIRVEATAMITGRTVPPAPPRREGRGGGGGRDGREGR